MIEFSSETEEERLDKGHCKGCFSCKKPCGRREIIEEDDD